MFSRADLLDGLGNWHHPITTKSSRAQAFFDQGLRLAFAFNDVEAYRAFRQAAAEDPNCAMAYWGMALVCGPNINRGMSSQFRRLASEAMARASELAPSVSQPERDYISALKVRYLADSDLGQSICDLRYSERMHDLAARYPEDLDAATLYAESLMDLSPGDYWYEDGRPRPHTGEILSVLEGVLKRSPNHPGANHYYIHAVEASRHPEAGLPCAERIGSLMPGAGHMVHMAAHIYMRIGRYHDASEVNFKAMAIDHRYLEMTHAAGEYTSIYCPHNTRFLWASLSMEGRSREAIYAAREVTDSGLSNPDQIAAERQVPIVYVALVRFGRWQEVLTEAPPPSDLYYSTAVWHYARGMAFAELGSVDKAKSEAHLLDKERRDTPASKLVGVNGASSLLRLASDTLDATIAIKEGRSKDAIYLLSRAVDAQERLKYDEPPPWYYPVRETLGAAVLAQGQVRDAEAVYRASLETNPESGWSLHGLEKSLAAEARTGEARTVHQRFITAWKYADIDLDALN
ncbi:MAG: tetratricopeptide repeat protein [Candidatus Binataceae bacterium]